MKKIQDKKYCECRFTSVREHIDTIITLLQKELEKDPYSPALNELLLRYSRATEEKPEKVPPFVMGTCMIYMKSLKDDMSSYLHNPLLANIWVLEQHFKRESDGRRW